MLEKLFGSKIRAKVLGWFFTHSEERYFVRQLAQLIKEDPTNISRELSRLERLGILLSEEEGNLKYYRVNKGCPFFGELRGLVLKTVGVAGTLKEALQGVEGIKGAFIYGSFAHGSEGANSDVDLILIGELDQNVLDEVISEVEKRLGRTVNYILYTPEEFAEKSKEKGGFLAEVLRDRKIMLIGSEGELKGS